MLLSFGRYQFEVGRGGIFLALGYFGSVWMEREATASVPYLASRSEARGRQVWAGRLHAIWDKAGQRYDESAKG